jgi:hypothetical protein
MMTSIVLASLHSFKWSPVEPHSVLRQRFVWHFSSVDRGNVRSRQALLDTDPDVVSKTRQHSLLDVMKETKAMLEAHSVQSLSRSVSKNSCQLHAD